MTNHLDDGGIQRATAAALEAAQRQPEDPDFPGLPTPTTMTPAQAFDEVTAEYSPEERAKAVSVVCRKAKDQHLNASGYFRTGATEVAVANSHGVFAYHPSSFADFLTTAMSDDSAGKAQESNWHVDALNPEAIGDEALDKAVRGRNPRRVEPGAYTVIIDPYVTRDLVEGLNFYGIGATAVQEGRSWMCGRMGQAHMSPLVSIWDDGYDTHGAPMPFDFEGIAKQRVDIVTNGVIGSPVYDSYSAAKEGKVSTGHALSASERSWGPLALNLFMGTGDKTVEDMIRSTERGLYITAFWYTRLVHPRDCVVTGMTRNGVFLIENGAIAYPVKNLRFTQSYLHALANVEMVGNTARLLIDEYGGNASIPALKIANFNFTGVTA